MLTTRPRWSSSRQASISFFSVNGSPTWTLGRFSSRVSSNSWLASTEAPPMPSRPVLEPISTTWLPGPLGDGAHDLVGAQQAGAHGVDQAVAGVGVFEVDLAAHRGDAQAVAVEADAADHAVEQEALAGVLGAVDLAEAQRVERHAGPRAHGEDVAHDAADAGGGALEGFDRRRVVVALDLHGHGPAVADVDDAGVLAGPLQNARAARGEAAQDGPRVLVAAVLAPHERVDGELDVGRLAAPGCGRCGRIRRRVRPSLTAASRLARRCSAALIGATAGRARCRGSSGRRRGRRCRRRGRPRPSSRGGA